VGFWRGESQEERMALLGEKGGETGRLTKKKEFVGTKRGNGKIETAKERGKGATIREPSVQERG